MDRFVTTNTPGLLVLHGYGNVFERRLTAGESILIEPGAFLYKDAAEQWALNQAWALEMSCEMLGIGHVVSMGQEYVGNTAQRLELLNQRRDELRRVDQPVASAVPDEVAVAAI